MGIPIPTGGRGGIVGLVIAVLVALVGGGFGLNAMTAAATSRATTPRWSSAPAENAPRAARLPQHPLRQLDPGLLAAAPAAGLRQAVPAADTVFFSQAVNTACGQADSGVGPFYCPADSLVYIDLSFYEVLARQLGAEGEFAQPYVLAHEYGHHVQNLLGTNEQVRRQQQRDPGNANELSVRLELQADCYAGAWAKNATGTADERGQKIFTSITERDIAEAIDTAEAIGDDAISKRANRPVNRDEFTHGSSEQRKQWFNRGYDSGDPASCDTFTGAV